MCTTAYDMFEFTYGRHHPSDLRFVRFDHIAASVPVAATLENVNDCPRNLSVHAVRRSAVLSNAEWSAWQAVTQHYFCVTFRDWLSV